MIDPHVGLSGASGKPITIRAFNDGKVLLNGQFARRPVDLDNNDHFEISGINAKSSDRFVVLLNNGASNNIFRRGVFWDSSMLEGGVLGVTGASAYNLFEDIAFLGTGDKTLNHIGGSMPGNTCRRCFVRIEGTNRASFNEAISLAYGDGGDGMRCENCIAIHSLESSAETYRLTNNAGQDCETHTSGGGCPVGTVTNYSLTDVGNRRHGVIKTTAVNNCSGAEILGTMAFLVSTPGTPPLENMPRYMVWAADNCTKIRHTLAYVDPAYLAKDSVPGFQLDDIAGGTGSAANITSIRSSAGGAGDIVHSSWGNVGLSAGTSISGVANPWTSTGSVGANLCHRWVNGVRTNQPLWPWPMNERIKQATGSAGAYAGPCNTCTGGRKVRAAFDLTAFVESKLGAIPSQCRTTSTTPPPPSSGLSGDLNADGQVNASDLQLEVNVILGTETNSAIRSRADLNGDGAVNALDLQRLVNIILGD